MPVMILVTIISAQWMIRRLNIPSGFLPRFSIGILSLSFLLAAEIGVAVGLRGLSISGYLATRDLVSGTVYFIALGLILRRVRK